MSTADFSGVLMAVGIVASGLGLLMSVVLTICKIVGIVAMGWVGVFLPVLIPMAFLGVAGLFFITQIVPFK